MMHLNRRAPLRLVVLLILSLAFTACLGEAEDDADGEEPTVAIAASPSATMEERGATSTATTSTPAAPATAPATPTDVVEATTEPSPTTNDDAGTPSGQSDAEIVAEIERVEAEMAELRGLEPQDDVEEAIIARDQLAENLIESLEEEYSPEEADEDTRILWLLRLIEDPELDLYQLYLDLYTESILGYYDPEADELYLVSDTGFTPIVEMTMAHEFVHALQDQHYDLEVLRPLEMEADQASAITALVEGDAELSSTLYALQVMDPADLQALIAETENFSTELVDAAPAYIRESLYFPYVQGIEFVTQLYQTGGYEAVDGAYSDPPTSTEQILHPETYIGAERDEPEWPEEQNISAALGEGWEQTRTDTLGEFDLRIMLRENGATNPDDAAAGWDGGRYSYYHDATGEADLVTVDTVWDTEADADEFVAAMAETYGNAVTDMAGVVFEDDQGRYTAIVGDGVTVTIVTGTDRTVVEKALAAVAS